MFWTLNFTKNMLYQCCYFWVMIFKINHFRIINYYSFKFIQIDQMKMNLIFINTVRIYSNYSSLNFSKFIIIRIYSRFVTFLIFTLNQYIIIYFIFHVKMKNFVLGQTQIVIQKFFNLIKNQIIIFFFQKNKNLHSTYIFLLKLRPFIFR